MIFNHPIFGVEEENLPLIRYMDISKFTALIKSNSLYFAKSTDLLSYDKDEGSLTDSQHALLMQDFFGKKLIKQLKDMRATYISGIKLTGNRKQDIENIRKRALKNYEAQKDWVFLNCWTINKYESDHMWSRYANKNGVAIVSNLEKLKNGITDTENIICRKVGYYTINETSKKITKELNPEIMARGGFRSLLLEMLLNKRIHFQDDRELRLIYSDETTLPADIVYGMLLSPKILENTNTAKSKSIKIDPTIVIDKIILHPNHSKDFHDKVVSLLENSGLGELKKRIKTSEL